MTSSSLVQITGGRPTALLANSGSLAYCKVLEFFSAHIRNANTRQAYFRAASDFLHWADLSGVKSLHNVRPLHVAAWIDHLSERRSPATVKQHLAAVSRLFDWLVVNQVVPLNPAASVRGPRVSLAKGKTPVLDASEARQLLDSIDTSTIKGMRDKALISIMLYSFARVGAVLAMNTPDLFTQNRRLWLRLHEKGGKLHDMPCHHQLEELLHAYVEMASFGDIGTVPLFQSIDRTTNALSGKRLQHNNAYQMVIARTRQAGIETKICNHSFRATGITTYLSNNGSMEIAAKMANHSSLRTTQLYDRRSDQIVQAEVEKINY